MADQEFYRSLAEESDRRRYDLLREKKLAERAHTVRSADAIDRLRSAHADAQKLRWELDRPLRDIVSPGAGADTDSGDDSTTDGERSAKCLSNRRTFRVKSTRSLPDARSSRWLEDRSIGVDRVSISFPVGCRESDPSAWGSVEAFHGPEGVTERLRASVLLPGEVPVYVGIQEIEDANPRWWGKLEFNPSRVVDPEGWGACGAALALQTIAPVMEAVVELVEPRGGADEWRLKRLDVVRDFQVGEWPANVISGLGPVKRPYARKNLVHADPTRHGAQTLMVGSGAGVVRLYDKCAETKGRAPEGTVRWELEARARWLMRWAGARTVAELNAPALQGLVENRWEWSAMGIGVSDDLTDVVSRLEDAGLSDRVRAGYVGWLVMRAAGRPLVVSRKTESRYRRIERETGISFHRLAEAGGVTRRLDFETGEVVREVA